MNLGDFAAGPPKVVEWTDLMLETKKFPEAFSSSFG
jgi:hypothetical protein